MNNTLQPKTSYQDFLKDIYNAMKKINQNTTEINDKLEAINKRLSNIEASQLYLGEQIQIKAQPVSSGVSDSHLLELMTKLDGPAELPDVLFTLNSNPPSSDVLNTSRLQKELGGREFSGTPVPLHWDNNPVHTVGYMISPQKEFYDSIHPATSPDNNYELESYSASPALCNIYESPTSSGFLILE